MSIRLRLLILSTLFTSLTLGLAFASYRSFKTMREHRQQLDWSYILREEVREAGTARPSNETMKRWQEIRDKLTPPRRQEEFATLYKSYDQGNLPIYERRSVFLKNETEYQRYTREQLNFYEKRLVYFGILTFVTLAISFLGAQFFLQRWVIRPLRDLSQKMVDFLHDRYTYQFNVPSMDEIGHMQSTFNSLAQRVISNMEQLRTLDQAKSEFLSIASHELRTPLTSIKGSLSLMRSGIVGKINEMADNLVTIAETETDRLIRLINDILDLAKIEARKLPLQQDWHPFNKLVKTCLESLQGLAQQANVKLAAESMPRLEVYMDSDRVQQVLTNLLSNAIKFSPEGKPVTVRCVIDDNGQLLVEVADRGRGIDPQDQEAIFQKFRQATSASNPLVKGTGLGLAIARALVEEHGGTIGVRSVVGEGSTFYFTLPNWRYSANKRAEAAA